MNSNSDEQAPDNAKQKITPVYFEQAVIEPIAFAPADEKVAVRSLQLKPLNLLLTLMLLIGLTLVWFLFTAKSVVIKTMPATSELSIEGGVKFELDNHFLMPQGQYQLCCELSPGNGPFGATQKNLTCDRSMSETLWMYIHLLM